MYRLPIINARLYASREKPLRLDNVGYDLYTFIMTKTRIFHALVCLFVVVFAGCAQQQAYRLLDRAIAYEANGDYDDALTAFQEAVDVCPQDAVLHRWLGRAHLRRSQFDAAQTEFELALSLAPSYLVVYRDLAVVSEALEMPDAAISWLEQAVAKVPEHEDSQRDLVGLYLAHDHLSLAQSLLDQVVAQRPEAAWAHFQLGGLYLALKWPERAEASFARVLEIEPQNDESNLHVRAHSELGNVYFERKEYEKAEEFYKKALDLNPLDDSSMNNLAWVYALRGVHLREGIRLSRRSLRLRPQAPSYMDTLAELYYKLGNTARAIQIIRQAIAQEPDDPVLRIHLQRQLAKFMSGGQGKV